MSPQDAADTILTLLSWCEDNHIFIDSRLAIVRDEATNGIAVRNATDAPIESPPTRESRSYSGLAWVLMINPPNPTWVLRLPTF